MHANSKKTASATSRIGEDCNSTSSVMVAGYWLI